MLHLAWKNIQFRKMRAVLTALGVGTSILLVVMMTAILQMTEENLVQSFSRFGGQVRIQPQSDMLDGASIETVPAGIFLDPSEVAAILAEATGYDEAESSPVVYQVLANALAPNQPARLVLNGVLPGREQAVLTDLEMAEGVAVLENADDVILGAGAVTYLNELLDLDLKVGDRVTLQGAGSYTVAGIAKARDAYSDSLFVVNIATAQEALKRGNGVNFVILSYPMDEVKEAAAQLKERFSGLDVVTSDAMLEAADKALSGQRSFFQMINGTVFLTATMIIFMVMYSAVMERTKEIGTMRAVGTPRYAIVGAIMAEAVIFTMVGGVIGTTGAFLLISSWDNVASYIMNAAGTAVVGALVISVLSSLYPAVRAARINPLEALRYE